MIKIIKGVYGYMENLIVRPKTSKDAPFELTPEQEKRLVDLGVAEYVDEPAPELPDLPDGVEAVPEYSADMKADELRAIAKGMGLTFKVGTTKAEMVAAMDRHIMENTVDEPPAFDAAEAVE